MRGGGWHRFWDDATYAPIRTLLIPLELLYRATVAARNLAFGLGVLRSRTASIPVLSVGNITVGGTGKTPVVAALVRDLVECGIRPAVVTRGYGADEVELHRAWNPDVPVIVAKRRTDGVRRAAAAGAQAALLDDGFQHRWLRRDLDIVLVSADRPFPGALLPRGPFREPASSLGRADLGVVTRKGASSEDVSDRIGALRATVPELPVLRIDLVPAAWTSLAGDSAESPTGPVLVVASVADPDSVVTLVQEITGVRGDLQVYPDHHEYQMEDARAIRERAGSRPIVTTSKDAVKLVRFADVLDDVRVLHLSVKLGDGKEHLEQALDRFVMQVRRS